jgi:hypothetical protein
VIFISIPFSVVTEGNFELSWVAMPWHLVLHTYLQQDTSTALGFVVNGTLIGALLGHNNWQNKQPPNESFKRDS